MADGVAEAWLDHMEQLRDCPADQRHAELVAWARSAWWHPLLMSALGWQGEIARDAYRALRHDLNADTPARRWDAADPMAGRASILRLLGLEGEPTAAYAAAPFRTWFDDDDQSWIAGAVGIMPFLDPDASMRWRHLDIREVILWNPRTNEARVAGEHSSTSTYVLPDRTEGTLRVWGDPAAFFRAWAIERVRIGSLVMLRVRKQWAHPIVESEDGGLPGALLVGDPAAAVWPQVHAERIVAKEGVRLRQIRQAAFRAAGFPAFEEATA